MKINRKNKVNWNYFNKWILRKQIRTRNKYANLSPLSFTFLLRILARGFNPLDEACNNK